MLVSYRWIDANGQLESTPYLTTQDRATAVNVEAMADALVAASNANLYDIVLELHTAGNASASTATEAPRESVHDFINTLVRDPASRKTQEVAIPAPLDSLFLAGTNIPDITVVEYQAVNTAANNLLPAAYAFISVRFAEHKKVNQKVKF